MELKNLFKKNSVRDASVSYNDESYNSYNHKDVCVNVPDGLYTKCPKCSKMSLTEDVYINNCVCPLCGHYMRIDALTRISMIIDKDTFEEWDTGLEESNPCDYPDYEDKLKELKEKTNLDEAVLTGVGCINGIRTVIGVCDTRFLMGSMGEIVGEKLTRAVEKATRKRLPIIIYTCSGGARMQEGIVSLMQMAKISAALKRHDEAGLLYITVLTDPTTGGVTASFAMLGDIILAEPEALVAFAGPRVIKQTIRQELPKGFQRSEFLMEHGFVDAIVPRKEQKETLSRLLKFHNNTEIPHDNTSISHSSEYNITVMKKYLNYLDNIYSKKIDIGSESEDNIAYNDYSAWDKVHIARDSNRPNAYEYINRLTKDFYELHGDRLYADDKAVVGGIAMFGGQPVTVIGHMKGKDTKDNIKRNFGMANPEGYRKALRLMKQAEKFNRPVICFIDTPGAYCGIGAEERGQGEAIARNLYEMSGLKVPVLSIVTGEGGSGGALAFGVSNEVWMMENAVYSVLSPEGFASIMWKDAKRSEEAAGVMKLTAMDLYELHIIERIIPEYPVISGNNINRITLYMKRKICEFLINYMALDKEEVCRQRYDRFRAF